MLRRAAAVACLALAAGLLPVFGASADSATGWSAPAKPSGEVYHARYLTASPFGVAYSGDDPVIYRATGASSDTVVDIGGTAKISGTSLIYTSYSANGHSVTTTFVDLSTGSATTRSGGLLAANLGGVALDSACCTNSTTFKLHHADGTVESITIAPRSSTALQAATRMGSAFLVGERVEHQVPHVLLRPHRADVPLDLRE